MAPSSNAVYRFEPVATAPVLAVSTTSPVPADTLVGATTVTDVSLSAVIVAESPFSGNARGIVKGQIFNRQGELVASTMQEGLMRKIDRQGE